MIPVVDVNLKRTGAWERAFLPHGKSMRDLIRALNREGEKSVGKTLWWMVKKAVGVGNFALGGHYRDESVELAAAACVDTSDILTANLAYDLVQAGCSTLTQPAANGEGALLARNLDWELGGPTLLQRTLVLGRFTGAPAGAYVSVLWPGLYGGLTAMAPGRFSLSINFVRNVEAAPASVGKALLAGAWPVTWATRHVLDNCRSFSAAVTYLRKVEVAAPVLFTLAGTKAEERVVIERSRSDSAIRKPVPAGSPVFTTNHYVSSKFEDSNDYDHPLMEDSASRYAGVEAGLARGAAEPAALFKSLSRRGVIRPDTQYQVVMSAADGVLHCRLPGRRAQTVTM